MIIDRTIVIYTADFIDRSLADQHLRIIGSYIMHAPYPHGPWKRHRKGARQKRYIRIMTKLGPVK